VPPLAENPRIAGCLEGVVKRRELIFAASLSLLGFTAVAQEPPVRIVATIALQAAIEDIEPLLRASSRVPVTIEFATTAALVERLANGESADVAILTQDALQRLAAEGSVRAPIDLVRSLIGIAVRDDAPLPAMRTTDDFVAFMRATPSIAYTLRGVSGVHMAGLIEQLGLADVVKPKAVIVDGFAATPLRAGEVVAAVQQISELRFAGAEKIVPLPPAIQVETVFSAAVVNGTTHGAAAVEIVRVLTSPEAARAYERSGSSPAF
jgi:molybdate transport system substrate-binding protein